MTTDDAVSAWVNARRNLLDGIAKIDEWTISAKKGNGKEVIEPTPLMPLWKALGKAEADLYKLHEHLVK